MRNIDDYMANVAKSYEANTGGIANLKLKEIEELYWENEELKNKLEREQIRGQKSVVDWFWVGLIIGVFLTTLFFVL